MRVAYLLGSLNRGGAESLLLDVFRNAEKAKYDFIGIHRHGGEYKDDFYATGKKLYYIQPKRWKFVSYLLKLRKTLKSENIQIVHAQMAIDAIYAHLATIGLQIKVILTFHGFDIGANGLARLRNRIAIRVADRICFVSEYERQDYEQKYPIGKKGRVVYNGIDFDKIVQCTMHNAQCPENKVPQLCCVGSFGSGRSQIVICKALGVLKDRGVEPEFFFIGGKRKSEPNVYDECFNYCQEHNLTNVHFMGTRSDVYELEKTMDGFVYSTVHDTFGIAVVEAIVVGLPVIVNDWTVMKEITRNGQWATLFKTEDIEDCANKIEDLLNNLEARKVQAKEIAKQVREEYSIEKHIARLEQIYAEIHNHKSPITNQQSI